MSNKTNEINDDEIRIITSNFSRRPPQPRPHRKAVVIITLIVAILAAFGIGILLYSNDGDFVEDELVQGPTELMCWNPVQPDSTEISVGYVTRTDTFVEGKALMILTPVGATASLCIGDSILDDPNAKLVMQAADVRGDNGAIAGAYVYQGELVSKGQAKAGFCSIINGDITIGVADATPMLEQALETGGYFFRQYPLVVGGQLVENKPKGKSYRRALADIGGRICVVISRDKLTFHDFSQALIDAGARNAIYLVGSSADGFYSDADGTRHFLSKRDKQRFENVNYIVWR